MNCPYNLQHQIPNVTTITIGTTGQTISLASGASSSGFGLTWNPTVQTTNFTASVNVGYMVNTTTAAITATLPAAPSIGDQVAFVDFNETAATNAITLNPNGLKIDGLTDLSQKKMVEKEGEIVPIDVAAAVGYGIYKLEDWATS